MKHLFIWHSANTNCQPLLHKAEEKGPDVQFSFDCVDTDSSSWHIFIEIKSPSGFAVHEHDLKLLIQLILQKNCDCYICFL